MVQVDFHKRVRNMITTVPHYPVSKGSGSDILLPAVHLSTLNRLKNTQGWKKWVFKPNETHSCWKITLSIPLQSVHTGHKLMLLHQESLQPNILTSKLWTKVIKVCHPIYVSQTLFSASLPMSCVSSCENEYKYASFCMSWKKNWKLLGMQSLPTKVSISHNYLTLNIHRPT